VLQECYKSVTRVLQECYESVARVLRECYEVLCYEAVECGKGQSSWTLLATPGILVASRCVDPALAATYHRI
jgi:hypothetical protein